MPFERILGQEPAVTTLRRALAAGKVHHAYRFEGPEGVGKWLAALELGRALLCETPTPEACGRCGACKKSHAERPDQPGVPAHPDFLVVERGLYRGSLGASEATGISIEQIRRIVLARVGFPPHEGRALVCVVRQADELTPSAANALLKTLEEPPKQTFFVLLTSRPSRLLDTIRSRTLPVRFAPLSEAMVAQLLAERGLDASVAPFAHGSMAHAVTLADPELAGERDGFVKAVQEALEAPDLATALRFTEGQKPERKDLGSLLEHLAEAFAASARSAASHSVDAARREARRYAVVERTLQELERNVGPQLALEAMMARLRRV